MLHLGLRSDVEGVAIVGGDAHSGNYFYLRRDVPYLANREWFEISRDPLWRNGSINYVVAERKPNCKRELEHVEDVSGLGIYRVTSSPMRLAGLTRRLARKRDSR